MPPARIPKEFSEALKGISPGTAYIRHKQDDIAGLDFAKELFNVLKSRGWAVRPVEVGDPQLFTSIDYIFSPGDDVIIKGRQMFSPSEKNPVLYGLENP
jgi:hypothetical protein